MTRWWRTWKEALFIPHGIPVLSACLTMCMPWSSSLSFVVSVAQLSGIVPGRVMLADAELCMASTRTALGGCSFFPLWFPPRSSCLFPSSAALGCACVTCQTCVSRVHAQCSTGLCEAVVPKAIRQTRGISCNATQIKRTQLQTSISLLCDQHCMHAPLSTRAPANTLAFYSHYQTVVTQALASHVTFHVTAQTGIQSIAPLTSHSERPHTRVSPTTSVPLTP